MCCGKKNHRVSECPTPATTTTPPLPSAPNSHQESINKKRKFDKGHLKITELGSEEDSGNENGVHPQPSDVPLDTPPF